MKNKGFTLIELLAVIVILAIIALIATPIILNIIDDTKESSKERSKELYLDAVANTIAAYNMKNPLVDLSDARCYIITENDEENNLTVGDLACSKTDDSDPIYIKVEMDGEKPKSGTIKFDNGNINKDETTVSFEESNDNNNNSSDNADLPTSPYIGCYADLDGNGEINVNIDGIIYADLAVGNTKGRQWGDENGVYTIPVETNLKEYEISENVVDGPFGERNIVTLLEDDVTKNKRFYVMTLIDFSSGGRDYFCWDANYNDIKYNTSNTFGSGATNTALLINYWKNNYNENNTEWSYVDIWSYLSSDSEWFVPSREEWAAFAKELEITANNNSTYGLNDCYWSSSQGNTNAGAWHVMWGSDIMFASGVTNGGYSYDRYYIRLSKIF